jgi:COP9 signalosome complex subunit 7
LGEGQNKQWLELLKIFAYGNVKTYKDREFPELTPSQLQKLRHLTIASLANRERSIPYAKLLDALQVTSLRELEDLIIEACYAGRAVVWSVGGWFFLF